VIRSRCAPETKVDATGVQRFERRELLGHDERRVIRQHDTAGSDAQRRGRIRDVRDEHGWRGTRHGGHPVVLGDPESFVTESLYLNGQRRRLSECAGR
jgi:hypothetical protein